MKSGLSNFELASNSTFVIALTRLKCPFCGYVSSDIRLTAPCPRCKQAGSARQVFPSVVCLRRLEIVADSYAKAYAAAGEKQAALVEQSRQILGRTPERGWLETAVRNVRKLVRNSRGSDSDYKKFLEGLQRRLNLNSRDEASRLAYLLTTYTDTATDHRNVVTSTASLYEQLFREFLVELLISKGEDHQKARDSVSKLRRRDSGISKFKSITGVPLRDAVRRFPVRGLYESWQAIAKKRNEYLHVTPWAVNAQIAERAFDAAKNSFGLFSFLHNTYCLAPIPAGSLLKT